jgi:hypothetical protein
MRFIAFLTLFTSLSANQAPCQNAPAATREPGVLAEPALPPHSFALIPSSPSLNPEKTQIAQPETAHDRKINRIWVSALIAVAAANAFDAGSSWGKMEGNSFLASSDGTFGGKGLAIKSATAGALIIPQILLLRHHQNLKGRAAIGDFATAGLLTGVSIHNLSVRAPR